MYFHSQDRVALYVSLHRLALAHVPGCTLEQVRKTANQFYDRANTRFQCAFVLYWELAEGRIVDTYADSFLEKLRQHVKEDAPSKEVKKAIAASFKNFWLEEKS